MCRSPTVGGQPLSSYDMRRCCLLLARVQFTGARTLAVEIEIEEEDEGPMALGYIVLIPN